MAVRAVRLQPLESANVSESMTQSDTEFVTCRSLQNRRLTARACRSPDQPLIQRRIGRTLGAEQPAPGSRHPDRASPAPPDRRRPAGSRPDRRHPNSPATMPCSASSRMQATAASSGIAMKAAAAWSSSCQASRLGSPQASPAISVSRLPGTVASARPVRRSPAGRRHGPAPPRSAPARAGSARASAPTPRPPRRRRRPG